MLKLLRLTILSFLINFLFLPLKSDAQILLDPLTQTKYINALPIPSVIDKRKTGSLTIQAKQFKQWLGITDPLGVHLQTTLFGYNGTYPGPTILARKFEPLTVTWDNKLVDATGKALPHLLPVDNTIHWAFGPNATIQSGGGVPLVTHLHGGHTEDISDGYPTAWYTPNYLNKGADWKKKDYYYANTQEAATIWYHDHTLGLTRANVMAGLAGMYLITDENQEELLADNRLPATPHDIPLFLQDRQFLSTGEIYYPSDPTNFYAGDPEAGVAGGKLPIPSTSIIPEFFGDFMLVNGMTWPVLDVEPRIYRFRVLNGSDSRMYNMKIFKPADVTIDKIMNPFMAFDPTVQGLKMLQIASDDGFLSVPAPLDSLFIAPGERKEIVVDFTGLAGQEFVLVNNANGPFPAGDMVDINTSAQIMKFRVSKPLNTKYPIVTIPTKLRPDILPLTPTTTTARQVILKEVRDEYGRLRPSLGTVTGGAMMWMDPTTEKINLNDTEEWEIYNETSDAHPIHLHSISMQLVNRQFYKADQFDMSIMMRMNNQSALPGNMKHAPGVSMSMMSIANTTAANVLLPTTTTGMPMNEGVLTNIQMLGMPMMPAPDELGWKDTWVIYPGQVMRIRAKFDLPGNYVWHCHILSHEDHDMMRPMTIVPNNLPIPPDSTANFIKKIQLQIMPNPFTTKATIQFKMKETLPVSIVLYNSLGKVVKTIFSGTLKPGSQYFYVTAADTKITGTYPVQIVVGKERASVNLLYVK